VTASAFLLLAVALAAAVIDWVAVRHGNRGIEYICKPATLGLLTLAALALDPRDTTMRAWFVVALLASLAGDVLLMLPGDLFVFGLGAFLAAHVAYVVGFIVGGLHVGAVVLGLVLAALGAVTVGRRLLSGVAERAPAMSVPVTAYMTVISAMLVVAVGSGLWRAGVGAVLFYMSDALIGWNRFVRPAPGGDAAVMVTYHLGQILLVLSLI
jgi:uncharacterized membrane protein YhhN